MAKVGDRYKEDDMVGWPGWEGYLWNLDSSALVGDCSALDCRLIDVLPVSNHDDNPLRSDMLEATLHSFQCLSRACLETLRQTGWSKANHIS